MKFVCMKCEAYMSFQTAEQVAEGSIGVMFACDGCGARFSMVTNPGETQLVTALGVKLGGAQGPHRPLETTRAALDTSSPTKSGTSDPQALPWTEEARQRLENIPPFVRAFAEREIEALAREGGATEVTAEILDRARERFMGPS